MGVEIRGIGAVIVADCEFQDLYAGIQFHNQDLDTWTENCVAENCVFELSYARAVVYKVTDGNNSFHGSGLRNCMIDTLGMAVVIEEGAYVYNAPLTITVWTHQSNPIILNNSGDATYYGHLGVEVYGPFSTVGADGVNPVNLLGTVQAKIPSDGVWSAGRLNQCTLATGQDAYD